MDKLHWSVDSLIVRNAIFFGFGWIFHEEEEIRDLKLKVRFANGQNQIISADYGKPRSDVAASFTESHKTLHSGYLFFGSFDQDSSRLKKVSLHGRLADGHDFDLKIEENSMVWMAQQQKHAYRIVVVSQLVTLLKRGLHLFKSGKFATLYEKAKRYLRGRPKLFLANVDNFKKWLKPGERRFIVLVIDHDLGGGANHYRERLVAERIKAGATVFILSYHVATLSYVLMLRNERLDERYAVQGYDLLLELAELLGLSEIVYNTGVSIVGVEELAQLIVTLKNLYNPRLLVLTHDLFMICPSHFLLDDNGNYCGIPDFKRCQSCLVKNQQGFVTLYREQDITQWRALWGNVIGVADEIRTFSNDTLRLLNKAYPWMDGSRAVVMPHKMEYFRSRPVRPSHNAALRIGVVGHIGYHKGAKIIQDLSFEIKRRGSGTKIVIIGTIEMQCSESVVRQTGPYQYEQLPALIEESGANVMLFPSIWPETFSYVVHELIELELPVACFDLGAQAERLSSYEKGLILTEQDPSVVFDKLTSFHKSIY